jgi:hypothetical protein
MHQLMQRMRHPVSKKNMRQLLEQLVLQNAAAGKAAVAVRDALISNGWLDL